MDNEILIYGEIGYDVTASEIVRQIKEIENPTIRINSVGGYLADGIAIMNAIRAKENCTTINDGIAYSMGAMILLCGKTVKSNDNALLLIHNVSGFAYGNAQIFEQTATDLQKHDESLSMMLCEKTGQSKEDVFAKFLNFKDNIYTAGEAKELGFVDEIVQENATINDPNFMDSVKYMNFEGVRNYFQKNRKNQPVKPQNPTNEVEWAKLTDFKERLNYLQNSDSQDVEKWKMCTEYFFNKMNEYGSQPGAMHTSPTSSGRDFEDEPDNTSKSEIDNSFAYLKNL